MACDLGITSFVVKDINCVIFEFCIEQNLTPVHEGQDHAENIWGSNRRTSW